jgi:hypothetical protein
MPVQYEASTTVAEINEKGSMKVKPAYSMYDIMESNCSCFVMLTNIKT